MFLVNIFHKSMKKPIAYISKSRVDRNKLIVDNLKVYKQELELFDKDMLLKEYKHITGEQKNIEQQQNIKQELINFVQQHPAILFMKTQTLKNKKQNYQKVNYVLKRATPYLFNRKSYESIPQQETKYNEFDQISRSRVFLKNEIMKGYRISQQNLGVRIIFKRQKLIQTFEKVIKNCKSDIKQIAPIVLATLPIIDYCRSVGIKNLISSMKKVLDLLDTVDYNNEDDIKEMTKLIYQSQKRVTKTHQHYEKLQKIKFKLLPFLYKYYQQRQQKVSDLSQSFEDVLMIYLHISIFKNTNINHQLLKIWIDAISRTQFHSPNQQLLFQIITFLISIKQYSYLPFISQNQIKQITNLYHLQLLWNYFSHFDPSETIHTLVLIQNQILTQIKNNSNKVKAPTLKKLLIKIFGKQKWRHRADEKLRYLLEQKQYQLQ